MSRRSVPRIAPADLRDHAEEARLDRVWARLDADLPHVAPAASRRPIFTYLAIAAAFSAFAGGIVVGKTAFQGPAFLSIAPLQTSERTTVDVLAAGTEGRNFPLPGGGQLQLQPNQLRTCCTRSGITLQVLGTGFLGGRMIQKKTIF